jgi:hypothetical protein
VAEFSSSAYLTDTQLSRLTWIPAGELAPLLLPNGVSVESEDQLANHARHTGSEQHQRIEGTLADPQWASITVLATYKHSA